VASSVDQYRKGLTMFITLGTLAIIVLIAFMLGMLTSFIMMMNALARMKK
jgi:hypothetical protein